MRGRWTSGLLVLLCAVVACSAAPSPAIRFDSVMSGYILEFKDSMQGVLVLQDAAAYQNWSKQLRGYVEPGELPRIDFDERLVVVAYLGVRGSTTGLSKPAALLVENDQLVLEVNEPAPGPRCVQLQQEQIPFVAVSIARANYRPPVQVRVHKVTEAVECPAASLHTLQSFSGLPIRQTVRIDGTLLNRTLETLDQQFGENPHLR